MLELITGALIAGATAATQDTAAQVVKDAYGAFKGYLVARFAKAKIAVETIEVDPNDTTMQAAASKMITSSGAASDPEVLRLAQTLADALKAHPGSGNKTTTYNSSSNQGIINQGSTVYGDMFQGDKIGRDKIDSQVNTGGGAYVAGNVSAGGDFVGRDKIIHNHNAAPELSDIPATARELVPLLNKYFGLSDIDSLCFEMGIDDEQLRGQTKDEKARSMVAFVQQNGRLDELKKLMRMARPNLRAQLS